MPPQYIHATRNSRSRHTSRMKVIDSSNRKPEGARPPSTDREEKRTRPRPLTFSGGKTHKRTPYSPVPQKSLQNQPPATGGSKSIRYAFWKGEMRVRIPSAGPRACRSSTAERPVDVPAPTHPPVANIPGGPVVQPGEQLPCKHQTRVRRPAGPPENPTGRVEVDGSHDLYS